MNHNGVLFGSKNQYRRVTLRVWYLFWGVLPCSSSIKKGTLNLEKQYLSFTNESDEEFAIVQYSLSNLYLLLD